MMAGRWKKWAFRTKSFKTAKMLFLRNMNVDSGSCLRYSGSERIGF